MHESLVHVTAYQETCHDNNQINILKAEFLSKGWDSNFSPCCPETTRPSAGTATTVKHPGTATRPKFHTTEFEKAHLTGRIQITCCTVNSTFAFYLCNVYGWTNGHCCTTAAGRTNGLFIAAHKELDCLPPLPCVITGDINANTDDIPELKAMLDAGWTDLG